MIAKLKTYQGPLLALGLLLLALSILAGALLWPTWWLHKRYDERNAGYVDKLIRYRRFTDTEPAIRTKLEEFGKKAGSRLYLKTNNPALAAAELQELVTRLLESKGARISSTQVLAPKEEKEAKGTRKIGLQLTFNGTTFQIQQAIHAVESNAFPLLGIDAVSIRAGQGRQFRPQPTVEPEFTVQISLSAYAMAVTK